MKFFTKPLLVLLIGIQSVLTFAQQNDTLEIQRNKNGKIIFARFQPSNARGFTDGSRFLKKLLAAKAAHEFRLVMETTDELGFLHQRYNQFYEGIKIENVEYLMHGRNGMVEIINGEYPDIDTLSISPAINELAAVLRPRIT